MLKDRIDKVTSYSDSLENLVDEREIEDQLEDLVTKEKPPPKKVTREQYLPDEGVKQAVDLSIALRRPLLVQGEPGCGKTRLAYSVAYALGLPLEVSYVKSTTRGQDLLYSYDAVNRLYDAQLGANGPKDNENKPLCKNIANYIRLGPLGKAIARSENGQASVVLIDEIDKADLDFPNDLLWELDRLEFKVSEAPEIKYKANEKPELLPIIIIADNEEKPLPPAFLRRCIFHCIEFPKTINRLQEILEAHKIDRKLSDKAINIIRDLREMNLNKPPGLSELIDWVTYLEAFEYKTTQLDELPKIGALLKEKQDIQQVKQNLGLSNDERSSK